MTRSQIFSLLFGIVAVGAVVYLRSLRTDERQTVREVVARMSAGSAVERYQAMQSALELGTDQALEAFRQVLQAGAPEARSVALMGISKLGKDAAPLLPFIRQQLIDDDKRVRQEAVAALGAVAGEEAYAVPELAQALEDPDAEVRCGAVRALRRSGSKAVPLLRRALNSGNIQVQVAALETAGEIGEPAAELTPDIAALLDQPRRLLRWVASCSLGRMGAEGVKALAKRLASDDDETQVIAAGGLILAGKKARLVQNQLLAGIHDNSDDVATACIAALDRCYKGKFPAQIASELAGVAKTAARVTPIPPNMVWKDGSLVLEDAWKVLYGLRSGGQYYVHRYLDAALTVDIDRRALAVLTLARHNPEHAELLELLTLLARDKSILVRRAVALSASLAARHQKRATRLLAQMQHDKDHGVRYIATKAIQALDAQDLAAFATRR